MIKKILSSCCVLIFLCALSCTFDYGDKDSSGNELPDLVMENVKYIRVRSADPLAQIQADRIERYESQSLIKASNITFEQYGEKGEEVYVHGSAGTATVEIDSGDIFMDMSVRLEVITEDITLETQQLEWRDQPRSISSRENDVVHILRENGTRFSGIGLRGDARRRSWDFLGSVSGVFVHDEDEEDE
jgi:LPS export ABC transporter protein LptC